MTKPHSTGGKHTKASLFREAAGGGGAGGGSGSGRYA